MMNDDLVSRQEVMVHLIHEYNRKADDHGLKLAWIEKAVNEAKCKMGWIPVTEELPEEGLMVLVTAQTKKGDRNVNRAYQADGFWHGSGSMSNVIAWMPLPEPYKGEVDG